MPSLRVDDVPYQYEAEADAGVVFSTGERWTGTLLRWRPGTTGRWRKVHLLDVHPFDVAAVERGLIAWIKQGGRG